MKIITLLILTLKLQTLPIPTSPPLTHNLLTLSTPQNRPKPRKLPLEYFSDPKNILGGGLSMIGGKGVYNMAAPDYVQKSKVEYLKNEINGFFGKFKILLMDRGGVLHDVEHLIERCEQGVDDIKSGGLNAIYGISSVIESQNKEQMVNIKKYSRKMKIGH